MRVGCSAGSGPCDRRSVNPVSFDQVCSVDRVPCSPRLGDEFDPDRSDLFAVLGVVLNRRDLLAVTTTLLVPWADVHRADAALAKKQGVPWESIMKDIESLMTEDADKGPTLVRLLTVPADLRKSILFKDGRPRW